MTFFFFIQMLWLELCIHILSHFVLFIIPPFSESFQLCKIPWRINLCKGKWVVSFTIFFCSTKVCSKLLLCGITTSWQVSLPVQEVQCLCSISLKWQAYRMSGKGKMCMLLSDTCGHKTWSPWMCADRLWPCMLHMWCSSNKCRNCTVTLQ